MGERQGFSGDGRAGEAGGERSAAVVPELYGKCAGCGLPCGHFRQQRQRRAATRSQTYESAGEFSHCHNVVPTEASERLVGLDGR